MNESDGFMVWKLKKFSELTVGDIVKAPNKQEVTISRVYQPRVPEDMFVVTVSKESGDSNVNVSGDHLFYIETAFDRQYYSQRLKIAKRNISRLGATSVDKLVSMYDNYGADDVITLDDFMYSIGCITDQDAAYAIYRLARSIGHIQEANLMGASDNNHSVAKLYPVRRLSELLLGVLKHKGFERVRIPVGRVVTAREMFEMVSNGEKVYIPE